VGAAGFALGAGEIGWSVVGQTGHGGWFLHDPVSPLGKRLG
jgi:hypothetical protein